VLYPTYDPNIFSNASVRTLARWYYFRSQARVENVLIRAATRSFFLPRLSVTTKTRVLLGEITTVHGVRGDVVIRSHTADPADIASYGELETADGRKMPPIRVIRVTDRGVIAHIAGIDDRTAAEALRGTGLWIARANLPAAAEGEYYHADLVGLAAVAPDGTSVGTVAAVDNFGAGDLLEIRLAGSNITEYVPFTNAFVPTVDIAAGKLTVVMPEGGEDDETDDA
jgi:16S rRNA processing protein RimM